MSDPLFNTEFSDLKLASRGKVRDIYDLGDTLLIVATDRLSAFDVVLPTPIPGKGEVLTQLSAHWFGRTRDLVANHLLSTDPRDYPEPARRYADLLRGRSMLVRKARPLPVECIVRGYLSGSGWKDYRATGSVCGIPLPAGLQESQRFPQPIFTPSTKAEAGAHDENIPFSKVEELLGASLAGEVRDLAIADYNRGAEEAARKGILIADTKMELGILAGRLILIDELLTPDSSRFWRAETYRAGVAQESLDKQYVRDYLEKLDWNKMAPGPELPSEIVAETSRRYREIHQILTA
jgi:phosphoribosylaminoimidazole-succinocarboxamide synthase